MSAPDAFSAEESITSPTIREAPLITYHHSEAGNDNNDLEFESYEDGEDNSRPTKKRKCTSKVWDDFKEVTFANGTVKAECVHCRHRLSFNKNGSTALLDKHLNNCFEEEVDGKEKESQSDSSPTTSMSQSKSIDSLQNFEYDHTRKILSHMILVHDLPFELPEYEIFDVLMRCVTPDYQKVSCDTAKKDCIASFELEKKKLMAELKKVDRVSVTTDLWKSNENVSYMVVSCHYADSSWKLQKRILNFCEVPPPHSSLVLCDVLHKCLVEWEIEKKVWTVTVDHAAHNDAAVRILRENLSYNNSLSLDGKIFHVRCYAHIINLLVQEVLSAIQDVIIKVRESVNYLVASEMRINMFKEIAKQLESSSMDLVLDCSTKWFATNYMLSAAFELKDVFSKYQQRDTSYTLFPSEEEWEKVRVVGSFLEEFYDDIQLIKGAEYPTSNLFLIELTYVKQFLSATNVGEDTCLKDMVTKMKAKLDKYWAGSNLLLSVAAVLDPRNKMKFLEWCYKDFYSSADAVEYRTTVRETLHLLYNEYVEADKANHVESSSCGKERYSRRAPFEDYIRKAEGVKSELDEYLEERLVMENDTKFDALSWWKKKSSKFRILSKMARDVLSIPITTVRAESAYSAGSNVIDPRHASLGVDTMQVLLCAGDWLRARYGIHKTYEEMEAYEEINIT